MMRVSTGALLVFFLVGLITQAQGVIPTGFPDLVILEVKYETYFPKDIEKGLFTIVIKNRGAVDSATSKTAVLLLHDIYEQVYVGGLTYRSIAASLYGTASVPPVPAGASVTVAVEGAPVKGPCLVLVLADAPVTGKPLGQLSEYNVLLIGAARPGEMNNAFMFPLPAGITLPATFKNPAF